MDHCSQRQLATEWHVVRCRTIVIMSFILKANLTRRNKDEEGDMSGDDQGEEDDGISVKKKQRTEKMAAAALCVGIGSFSDPPDIPGLAHFLEHMVFMGSEKYPDENSFDLFIKNYGGSDNASTDCERTIFQFEVQQKCFQEALLRFAQFFVSPLLKEDSTDRELEAVDSEFQMSLPSDTYRKAQLLGGMCVNDHPMGKFMWGNTESIKTRPAEQGINVYQRLREFRERNYSSHYMTLVVQSQETLDTLESWVKASFSDIPNNNLPKETFIHHGQPFDSKSTRSFTKHPKKIKTETGIRNDFCHKIDIRHNIVVKL
ncbi:putative nardilysin-like [Apostichopus japonicus]|uniref:Putative nardilysin-like n=1 Tax=Stichopus japonicus TaxID=307972 RepID=A0A2G8LHP0_STIJA|nr:putative nardilysin-like [Apostichopus japonicus]